jgi:hypothetical protein
MSQLVLQRLPGHLAKKLRLAAARPGWDGARAEARREAISYCGGRKGRTGSAQPNASAWCRCAGRSCESSRGRESW